MSSRKRARAGDDLKDLEKELNILKKKIDLRTHDSRDKGGNSSAKENSEISSSDDESSDGLYNFK